MKLEENLFEKENPENREINQHIDDVLSGRTKDYRRLRKDGYEVEYDNSGRRLLGREHFGDNVKIKNPNTNRYLSGTFGQKWKKDTIVANPDTFDSKYSKYRHEVNNKAFDYKNYLDKPLQDQEDKLSTAQRFAKDKQFLKDKEWEAQKIDSARNRLAAIRNKYKLKTQTESLTESLDDIRKQLYDYYDAKLLNLIESEQAQELERLIPGYDARWSAEISYSDSRYNEVRQNYLNALVNSLIEQAPNSFNESLSDVEDKAREVVDPVYAKATEEIKANEQKKEETTKVAETPKTEEKPKNPQMAPGAKQMKLDESLFEDIIDEEPNEVVLVVYADESEPYYYNDQYQADGHYAELEQMSDTDLKEKGIIGFARLSRTDLDPFNLIDMYVVSDKEKVREAIDEFRDNVTLDDYNDDLDEDIKVDAMNRKRPTTYIKRQGTRKPLSVKVLEDLENLGYEVFASTMGGMYQLSKRKEVNLQRAKDYLDKNNISYDRKESQGRIYLLINLPDDSEEVDRYYKATDRLMVTENKEDK